jgi:hypothetical protein
MPFMPSYQNFHTGVQSAILMASVGTYPYGAEVTLTAASDARQWKGLRGPHRHPLLPQYEFAHDLDLLYRLLPADYFEQATKVGSEHDQNCWYGKWETSRCITTVNFNMHYTGQEERSIKVKIGRNEYTYHLNREENDKAYGQLAKAFLSEWDGNSRSRWLTDFLGWTQLQKIMDAG